MSALPSKDLDKYEYLTCEDPSTVQQARIDYSLLVNFLTGLKEEDKKERLLKRIENIENKNEEQLKAIENQRKSN